MTDSTVTRPQKGRKYSGKTGKPVRLVSFGLILTICELRLGRWHVRASTGLQCSSVAVVSESGIAKLHLFSLKISCDLYDTIGLVF